MITLPGGQEVVFNVGMICGNRDEVVKASTCDGPLVLEFRS